MSRHVLLTCLASWLITGAASADYILTPLLDGSSTAALEWGDSFSIDFVLSSDTGDTHDSAIFHAAFTEPGLFYTGYQWAAPYGNADPFDDSTPDDLDLPVALDADTFVNPLNPTLIDVELSNVLLGQTAGPGTLVTLDFTIPADYGFIGTLYVIALPDTFARGFDEITTEGGTVLALDITPEPSSGLLLLPILLRARRW